MKKSKVAIVIVYYKAQKEFFDCLQSLSVSDFASYSEVIIVDNNDTKEPQIEEKIKKIIKVANYIPSKKNIGFGSAMNLGVTKAHAEYLFLLNSDVQVMKETVRLLYNFCKNTDYSGLSPLILDKNMTEMAVQGSSILTPIAGIFSLGFLNKYFPNNIFSKRYYLKNQEFLDTTEVDVLNGSALFIKKNVFKSVRGFDENMFLYFEEADIFLRLKKLGYKFAIYPEANVIHKGGASAKSNPDSKKHFANSRFYYFKKNYGIISALIVEIFSRINIKAIFILIIILGSAISISQVIKARLIS